MYLRNRLFFACLFVLLSVFATQAQTLYWVGGSGNFNDPQHWSVSSGGTAANSVPNSSTTVIFDNFSFENSAAIQFPNNYAVKSLLIQTPKSIVFSGSTGTKLTIAKEYSDIADNVSFSSTVDFEFSNTSQYEGYISTGNNLLTANFRIIAGSWKINRLRVAQANSVIISNSNLKIIGGNIFAGNLSITQCNTLELSDAVIKVPGSVAITGIQNYSSVKSFLNKNLFPNTFSPIVIQPAQKNGGNNVINAPCVPTPTVVKPTCVPGCDGKIILTLPAFSCFSPAFSPTVYIIDISGCGSIPSITVTPGTYTINNVCGCASDYNVLVYDENRNNLIELIPVTVTQPNIANVASAPGTSTISCFGACTGTIATTFFGGTAPYSFTITSPSAATTVTSTNGPLTRTGICAGLYSISVLDAGNCTSTFTRTFTSPAQLLTNAVSFTPICNGDCNATFSIAPTGGPTVSPSYTVAFSTGATSILTTGGVASISGLCANATPITATVTDKNNCTANASTVIVQPTPIVITPSKRDILCNSVCDGTAGVFVSGGGGAYTYTWGPISGTNSSVTNLCKSSTAGTYTVTITDIPFGCVRTQTFFINDIPQITITNTVSNVVCFGSGTGSASITAVGGNTNSPYQFAWLSAPTTTISTTTQMTGQPAGTYSIVVTDLNACSVTSVVILSQPTTSINLSSTTQSVNCPGASNGTIGVTASGGNGAPFSYTWTPAVAGNVSSVVGVPAGTYVIAVADRSNCIASAPVTTVVIEPTTFTFGIVTSSVTCNGASTGAMTVTPGGASPPFNFTLTGASGTQTNSTGAFINLPAGNYTVTVNDANAGIACAQSTIVAIIQPTLALVPAISFTNPNCFSACNASLVGTTNGGGTPGYTFNWSTPTGTILNTQNLNNRCAGVYILNVVDSKGCLAPTPATVTVTQPSSMTISFVTTSVSCAPGQGASSNGAIATTVSGGTGAPSFTWTPPAPGTQSFTPNLSNLPPGVYSLVFTDANTCVQPVQTVTVQAPSTIFLGQTTTSTTCSNLCNGSAIITATNGVGALSYAFTGTTTITNGTGVFSGVCGPFTVTVTDVNSCTVAISNTVGAPPVYAPALTTSLVTCFGICDGRITSSPTGGIAPYTYTLLGASAFSATSGPANTATFTALCAGNYTLLIQDSRTSPAFCPQSFTTTITQPVNSLTATALSSPASCFGVCNGSLSGSAVGGSGTYTSYVWTSSTSTVTAQNVINRCANTYSLRVTDSNGCQAFATTTVTEPPTLTVAAVSVTNVSCFGGNNGALNITPSGGPVAGTYAFTWTPSGQSAATATALTAQTYSVAISKNGCTQTFTLAVTQPAQIVITSTATNERCIGSCDGQAVITVSAGGVAPFTYSLTGAPTPTNSTGIFTGLCAGTYAARVTDNNGCFTTTVVTINSPSTAVAITTVQTRPSCATCTGAATITASGGTTPYSFAYTNSLGLVPTLTGTNVGGMCPGPFTVVATDANTCTTSFAFTINPVIIIASATNGTTSCFGASDGAVSVSVTGGSSPYSYTWTPSAQSTSNAINLAAGIYTVRVTDNSSPVNCETFAQATVTPASSINVVGTVTNVSCPGLLDGAITVTASGGIGVAPYAYTWSPTGSTSTLVSAANFGVHTVTVTKGTCSVSASFTVGSPNPPITATLNAFSPNNCASPNNGSIAVTAGGGNGTSYTYSWSPVASTNSAVTSLTAGVYNVTVTSAGCSSVFPTTLTAPLAQTLTPVSSQSVACFSASTGALSFSTTAPTPSYTWIPATASVVAGATTTASNLPAGTYTLLLRDINSCTNSVSINVPQSPSITTINSQTNVLCFNGATGIAQTTVSGGSPGYTYTWSTGATGAGSIVSVNSLTASATGAVYTATITDSKSCTSLVNYTLTSPPPFTFTTSATNISCFNAGNGSITVVASPSTGVTYSWAAVPSATFAGSTATAITNLNAGTYSIVVSNGTCNAIGINTVQIINPGAITSSLTINHNVTCFGGNNGMATYSVSGGTGVYSYTWTGTTSTVTAANTATGLTAGNYTVTVADINGCNTSTTFAISGPSNFNATLTATNPKCTGAFNGSITTQVTGGQGAITYSWSPAGLGQNPGSLSAGTGSITYTLTMSDDSLCTVNKTVTLVDPLPIGAIPSFTNPSCFSICDGAAQITPTNAVGTPTITWLPSNTTGPTKTGLCGSPTGSPATVYTVTLVDANGCNISQSFTLASPSQITATYNAVPALCGQNTGSVSVTSSGGTGTLSYNWFAPLTGSASTQSSLAVGVYSLQISDANACTQTITIPISASNGPTATVNNTSLTCFGNTNGSATISAISPTNAIIQWLTPLTSTSTVVTGLGAGSYSVGITNPTNSCTVFYGIQVSSPPILTAATSSAEATCFGICDGSVAVIPGGGVTPYNFSWVGPNGFTSTLTTLTNLCGGDYTLTLSDANSCTLQPAFSLPVLNNIIIQQPIRTVNNICFSQCVGAATIDVVSTTTTVLTSTISWSSGQFGPIANNLCSGVYTVLVTDTRGCSNTFSVPITSAPDLTLTTAITAPNCNQCNGGASVTASGGNGPAYTYSWTGGQTTPTLTNLCAGLYQVVVSDALNCTQIKNVAVNNSNGIIGETITTQDEQCFGSCNGAATITAIGGTAPIGYSWINPSLTTTLNTATNLCPGTYFIQMSDANNCIRTSSLNIGSAVDLTVTTFVTPPSCTAVPADGALVANVSGNVGAITYSWAPIGATTFSVANVGPGTYTLTVTDVLAGCTKTSIVTVGNLTGPQYTVTHTNVDCTTPGSASITASGTVTLNYAWSTGATTSVVANLQVGLVTVTVSSGNGCISISQVTISSIPAVQLNTSTQKVKCTNDCNGAIFLQAVNGAAPYTFSLSSGSSSNQTFSLCSGSYTAFVTDNKGCKDSTVVNLLNPPAITYTVNRNNSSCTTLADGSATVIATAGLKPYKFTFNNGVKTFTSNPATGLSAGVYTVSVIDSLGCVAPSGTTSIVPTLTVIANAGTNVSVCPNTDVVINASLSVGADRYIWSTIPPTTTVSTNVSVNLNVLETTLFQLYAESTVQPGCFDTSVVVVNVFQKPYLDVGQQSYSMAVYASTVIGGNPTALASGPTLTWTPGDYLDSPNALNPVASNTFDVTYTVTMEYGIGCFESDTVQVLIVPEIKPGNGFSPNGDGKNDLFVIDYIDQFPNNEVEIYNRWGDRLFYSKGYQDPWDGKFKGQPVPVGTYYYVIHLNHFAYKKPLTGPVTIFR